MKVIFEILIYVVVTPAVLYGLFLLALQYRSYFCKLHVQKIYLEEKRPIFRIYAKNEESGKSFMFSFQFEGS